MAGRNEIIAIDKCNRVRLTSKISRLDEKAEKVNKLVEETESQIKDATKMLDLVRLAKQMYELVILEESYVETLETAVEHESDNIPLMNSLQKSIDIRESRYKAAVKLGMELMQDKVKAIEGHLF